MKKEEEEEKLYLKGCLGLDSTKISCDLRVKLPLSTSLSDMVEIVKQEAVTMNFAVFDLIS